MKNVNEYSTILIIVCIIGVVPVDAKLAKISKTDLPHKRNTNISTIGQPTKHVSDQDMYHAQESPTLGSGDARGLTERTSAAPLLTVRDGTSLPAKATSELSSSSVGSTNLMVNKSEGLLSVTRDSISTHVEHESSENFTSSPEGPTGDHLLLSTFQGSIITHPVRRIPEKLATLPGGPTSKSAIKSSSEYPGHTTNTSFSNSSSNGFMFLSENSTNITSESLALTSGGSNLVNSTFDSVTLSPRGSTIVHTVRNTSESWALPTGTPSVHSAKRISESLIFSPKGSVSARTINNTSLSGYSTNAHLVNSTSRNLPLSAVPSSHLTNSTSECSTLPLTNSTNAHSIKHTPESRTLPLENRSTATPVKSASEKLPLSLSASETPTLPSGPPTTTLFAGNTSASLTGSQRVSVTALATNNTFEGPGSTTVHIMNNTFSSQTSSPLGTTNSCLANNTSERLTVSPRALTSVHTMNSTHESSKLPLDVPTTRYPVQGTFESPTLSPKTTNSTSENSAMLPGASKTTNTAKSTFKSLILASGGSTIERTSNSSTAEVLTLSPGSSTSAQTKTLASSGVSTSEGTLNNPTESPTFSSWNSTSLHLLNGASENLPLMSADPMISHTVNSTLPSDEPTSALTLSLYEGLNSSTRVTKELTNTSSECLACLEGATVTSLINNLSESTAVLPRSSKYSHINSEDPTSSLRAHSTSAVAPSLTERAPLILVLLLEVQLNSSTISTARTMKVHTSEGQGTLPTDTSEASMFSTHYSSSSPLAPMVSEHTSASLMNMTSGGLTLQSSGITRTSFANIPFEGPTTATEYLKILPSTSDSQTVSTGNTKSEARVTSNFETYATPMSAYLVSSTSMPELLTNATVVSSMTEGLMAPGSPTNGTSGTSTPINMTTMARTLEHASSISPLTEAQRTAEDASTFLSTLPFNNTSSDIVKDLTLSSRNVSTAAVKNNSEISSTTPAEIFAQGTQNNTLLTLALNSSAAAADRRDLTQQPSVAGNGSTLPFSNEGEASLGRMSTLSLNNETAGEPARLSGHAPMMVPEVHRESRDQDLKDRNASDVNNNYFIKVTIPSFIGLLLFVLLICYCLRTRGYVCRLFHRDAQVSLVEEQHWD